MAAVEMIPEFQFEERPTLRVVRSQEPSYRRGPLVAQRRAARARMLQRRRRAILLLAIVASLVVLAWPGHAFGGVNGVGLSTDLATSGTLSSGSVYVVQPGDTIDTIAQLANPVDPSLARAALVSELKTSSVVAGEHVLIP